MSVAFAQNSKALLSYPAKQIEGDLSNTVITAAGEAVTPELFGLNTIQDIKCGPVQIAGSVNTETLLGKYDAVTGKILFFYGNDNVAEVPTPLVVITGNISSAYVMPVTVFGT